MTVSADFGTDMFILESADRNRELKEGLRAIANVAVSISTVPKMSSEVRLCTSVSVSIAVIMTTGTSSVAGVPIGLNKSFASAARKIMEEGIGKSGHEMKISEIV